MAQSDRVTNAQLRDAISDAKDVIRAEQRSEHFKTRVLVAASAAITGGAKVAALVGFVSFPHL